MKISKFNSRVALRHAGFTLMELMLVLGIITLLIVAGMKIGPAIQKKGKVTAATAQIGTLSGFIQAYQSSSSSSKLPGSLDALMRKGDVTEDMLIDPWGNKYQYVLPAKRSKEKYDLFSMGEDGQPDTVDDVGNWKEE